MTLHIFNPEHDIALASNIGNFTAPHAGRQLRHDLGFLPALWAAKDETVLVDDKETALLGYQKTRQATLRYLHVDIPFSDGFVTSPKGADDVAPWGWDRALRARLSRQGVALEALPSDAQLDVIRQLSHRRTSAQLLPSLRIGGTVGEAIECKSWEEVEAAVARYGHAVLKAPWSSSGRGLRFVNGGAEGLTAISGWLVNLLKNQGSVMVEPYYNKVKDFGMEFSCDTEGRVIYEGLSLFHTANGAYKGNILATEQAKREMIGRYVSPARIDLIRDAICSELATILNKRYVGPLGVDMMVVEGTEGFDLHPCVEINLRRTMGHAALALTPADDDLRGVMRIDYNENHYKLIIKRL